MAEQQQIVTGQQCAVSLKLPELWTASPAIWFQQAEAQFALRHVVADETKYYYVVAALNQSTAQRLVDFLSAPPAADKYTAIKERLLEIFGLSECDRAARLLNMPPLGDRKPSALMDEMLALLGRHQSCFLFIHLFLQHMPDNICVALAVESINDPRKLMQKADALWLARPKTPELCRIRSPRAQSLKSASAGNS